MQTYNTPIVNVGIMSSASISFTLNGDYQLKGTNLTFAGDNTAFICEGGVSFNGLTLKELIFSPIAEAGSSFDLKDVTIGINFHWQQTENQRFEGVLKIVQHEEKLVAINIIDVEKYLTSVISSEMKATSSIELLKAHAVISRSWLIAQITKQRVNTQNAFSIKKENEVIRWYDHDDHTVFDVCADDHCQRYQGITKQTTTLVNDAIVATRGQILTADGNICDARFSKACGGVSETYENCWDDAPHSYLAKVVDNADESDSNTNELTMEANARNWILNGSASSFCNTTSKRILSQVLNNYDQKTADFYRWEQRYTQDELLQIIESKSGYSFGNIIDLQPVQRGESGRLIRLKIVGEKLTLVVGKELEIRRWLSSSHLYSSAFVVEKEYADGNSIPSAFVLKGAGWGHGAGLCQIGAAVMADKGYDYKQILMHYYKNAQLQGNYGK